MDNINCLACGYERKKDETTSQEKCPQCERYYSKVSKHIKKDIKYSSQLKNSPISEVSIKAQNKKPSFWVKYFGLFKKRVISHSSAPKYIRENNYSILILLFLATALLYYFIKFKDIAFLLPFLGLFGAIYFLQHIERENSLLMSYKSLRGYSFIIFVLLTVLSNKSYQYVALNSGFLKTSDYNEAKNLQMNSEEYYSAIQANKDAIEYAELKSSYLKEKSYINSMKNWHDAYYDADLGTEIRDTMDYFAFNRLKDPASFKLIRYSIRAKDYSYEITATYSATNGFGGRINSEHQFTLNAPQPDWNLIKRYEQTLKVD